MVKPGYNLHQEDMTFISFMSETLVPNMRLWVQLTITTSRLSEKFWLV